MGYVEKSQREAGRENSKTKAINPVSQSEGLLRVLLNVGDAVTVEPHENGFGRGLAVNPVLYVIALIVSFANLVVGLADGCYDLLAIHADDGPALLNSFSHLRG